jgi:hypothetical protein
MQTALIIFFVIVAIFSAAVIFSSVRKALRHRAAIRRRLAEIAAEDYRREHPDIAALWDLRRQPTDYHPDWGGQAEVTSVAPLYQRVRSARMTEIMRAADSMSRDDLVQAAIRLGSNQEIAEAYADEILDEGDPLPAAMAHSPNVGGEGNPDYQGGNYVEPEAIADEMQGIVHFGNTGRGE